jgi:hypothetical protein
VPAEKAPDDRCSGEAVLARFDGRERASTRQREGQQQLVREVGSGEGGGLEISFHPAHGALCELFRGHAELAEAAHHLGHMLVFGFQQQDFAWTLLLGQLPDRERAVGPVEGLARAGDLAVRDVDAFNRP